jgi:ketosteroid isomerase-like protein
MRIVSLLVAAILAGVPSLAQEKEVEAHDRFMALELKLLAAVQGGDAETMESLLSPDFAWAMAVEGRPNVVENRSEWIRGLAYYDLRSFDIAHLVAQQSDKAALVHFRLNVAAQVGRRTDVSGGYVATDLWEKKGDEWRLLRRFVSRPVALPSKN